MKTLAANVSAFAIERNSLIQVVGQSWRVCFLVQ